MRTIFFLAKCESYYEERMIKSLVQTSLTEGERLSLEQQKRRQKEGATLATEWATWLASLLTQEKIHRGKDKAKSKEREVKCLIF